MHMRFASLATVDAHVKKCASVVGPRAGDLRFLSLVSELLWFLTGSCSLEGRIAILRENSQEVMIMQSHWLIKAPDFFMIALVSTNGLIISRTSHPRVAD